MTAYQKAWTHVAETFIYDWNKGDEGEGISDAHFSIYQSDFQIKDQLCYGKQCKYQVGFLVEKCKKKKKNYVQNFYFLH